MHEAVPRENSSYSAFPTLQYKSEDIIRNCSFKTFQYFLQTKPSHIILVRTQLKYFSISFISKHKKNLFLWQDNTQIMALSNEYHRTWLLSIQIFNENRKRTIFNDSRFRLQFRDKVISCHTWNLLHNIYRAYVWWCMPLLWLVVNMKR